MSTPTSNPNNKRSFKNASNGNFGDSTDLWDGETYTAFTPYTNPSTASYAVFLDPNNPEKELAEQRVHTGIAVHNIRALSGGVMQADIKFWPENYWSGPIAEDTVWGPGTVTVGGDVTIRSGVTLTINVGTEVRFVANSDDTNSGQDPSHSELTVEDGGTLEAIGNSVLPIRFRSSIDGGGLDSPAWYGFRVASGSRVHLENVTIHDAVHCVPDGLDDALVATLILDNCGTPPTITGNESPEFLEHSEIDNVVATYTAADEEGDAVTWSLPNDTSNIFTISAVNTNNNQGELKFNTSPDFELIKDNPSYDVTVRAEDSQSAHADYAVTVTVTNREEAGAVTVSPLPPQVGVDLTATLTDPDEMIADLNWQWQRRLPDGDWTAILVLATQATYKPTSDDAGYELQATVRYNDGHGGGKNAESEATDAVQANVPSAPVNLTASAGDRQVTLTWELPEDNGSPITAYKYSTDSGNSWTSMVERNIMNNSNKGTTSYLVNDLKNGTAYIFQVRARNAVGDGRVATSNEVTPQAPFSIFKPGQDPTGEAPTKDEVDREEGTKSVATYTTNASEGTTVEWSLSGTDEQAFTINAGQLSFDSKPDFEAPTDQADEEINEKAKNNVYRVIVKAKTDEDEAEALLPVSVTVTNMEEDGAVFLNSTKPTVATNLTATLTDPDGGITAVKWQWQRAEEGSDEWENIKPLGATASAPYAVGTYRVVAADIGYQLRAKVSYQDGYESNTDTAVSVASKAVVGNRAPTIKGPARVSYDEHDLSAVGEYTASDPDGHAIEWLKLEGDDASAFALRGRDPARTRSLLFNKPPDYETKKEYRVTLQVRDNVGTAARDPNASLTTTLEVEVGVKNVEEQGIVKLPSSPPQVGRPFTAELQDPDGQIKGACWAWQRAEDAKKRWTDLTSCDEVRAFAGDAEATASSSYTPTAKDAGWLLRARVIYRDGQSGTEYREVDSAAAGPVVSGALTLKGPARPYVAENTTKVGLYETNAAAGTELEWSLDGADKGFFELREGTIARELHFASPPNYEKPTDRDGKNTYEVTVIVGDGTLKASVEAVVHVRDADDEGVITLSTTAPQVGDAVTATLTDEDGIRNGTVSWGWTYQRVPEEEFSAWDAEATRTETHPTRTITIPARHVGQRLRFYARYRDVFDQQTAKSDPTDPIRPAPNRAPTLSGAATAVVAENSTSVADYEASDPDGDRLKWSLRGADESFFELGTGTAKRSLQFKAEPNFEQPPVGGDNTYEVTVEVSDGTLQASVAVTVTVADADDEGVITFSTTQPKAGQKLKATLTDEDGGIEDATWRWNDAEAPATSTGVDVLTSTTLVESAWVGDPVRVMVSYLDALGSERDKAEGQTLAVVADVPAAPGNLAETAGHEQVVLSWTTPDDRGAAITGYDYRYSIDGGTTWQPDWTKIDGSTKDTTTYPVLGLTNEVEYTLEVRAVNGQGTGAAAQIKSTPYAPFVIEGDETPTVEENKTEVGTYTTNAPAGTVISWSVDGTDESAFSITAMGGDLSFDPAPNYEAPTDSNTDNDYVVEVVAATDDYTARLEVTVTVSNQDEEGQISLTPPTTPQVGQTITALLTDPDGGIVGAYWDWRPLDGDTEQAVEADADQVQAASAELYNYTPKKSDIGYPLRAHVLYNDDHGIEKEAETITAAVIDVPDAPSVSADGGDGQATIEWTVPNNNGSEIEAYEYRYKDSAWSIWKPVSSSTTTVMISDLTNEVEYTFAVRAINEAGAGPAGQDTAKPQVPFTIEGDKAPTVEENKTAVGTYTTNAPAGTVISWSVGGTDGSAFSITDGALSFSSAPNYESPADSNTDNDYVIEVIAATDDYTATVDVTVAVTDADEEGVVTLSTLQPQVGQELTATLTDEDSGVENQRWSWGYFSAETALEQAGAAATVPDETFTPSAVLVGIRLQARVIYDDDHKVNQNAHSVKTEPVIDVPDAPVVSADGGDGQATIEWTVPNNNGSEIEAYEYRYKDSAWSIWKQVSSSTTTVMIPDLTNEVEYTFAVRAINEAGAGPAGQDTAKPQVPFTIEGDKTPTVEENKTAVGTYTTNAPAGTVISWSVGGTDASAFSITDGALSFDPAPNYEAPTDSNTDNDYVVEVIAATDDYTPRLEVTVTVSNQDEEGHVSLTPPTTPQVGQTITALLTDPDGGINGAEWDWKQFHGGTEQAVEADDDQVQAASAELNNYTPQKSDIGYPLRAYVSYNDDHGDDKKKAKSEVTAAVIDVPDAPSVSTSAGDGRVTVSWTAPNNNGSVITGYAYRDSSHAGTTWTPWTSVSSSTRSATRSGLTNGTTYTFQVRAKNSAGDGPAGKATATPVSPLVLCGPRSLSDSAGNAQVSLSWSNPTGSNCAPIWRYEYRYRSSGGSWSGWSSVGTATSKTVTGLTNGTSYEFAVRAVTSLGDTSPLTVTATPVAPPPPPNRAPTITAGPASASVAENTTSVADYDASDPDGDAISWSATGAFSISSSGGLRFSSPPNYESGTTSYSTTVTARDPDGLSDTKSVSITVTNAEDTGTISLSPNPPQVGQTLQATLTDEDGGLKDVLWGATATGQASVEPQSHSWSTTFAVSRSWLGQPVRVIVSYRDALGPGKTAQTTSAAVVAGPPGAPRNLTATQVPPGYSQIGLTWSAPQSDGGSAIQHYEYQKNADPWSNIGNTTSYTASGLTGGTSYTFSIRAVNGVNKTGPSASVTLATRAGEVAEGAGKPVSLQRALADSVLAVVVAPNPFNPTTTLHLHLPADSPVKLVIYNMAGQRVQTVLDSRLQAGYHTFHWDGRDALGRATTSGVYLYRVNTPTQTLVGKMVLIR